MQSFRQSAKVIIKHQAPILIDEFVHAFDEQLSVIFATYVALRRPFNRPRIAKLRVTRTLGAQFPFDITN